MNDELYHRDAKQALILAKIDYFEQRLPTREIADKYGIPIETLKRFISTMHRDPDSKKIKKSWRHLRAYLDDRRLRDVLVVNTKKLEHLVGLSCDLAVKALVRAEADGKIATLKDAKDLANILGNAHKVLQLVLEKPTGIVKGEVSHSHNITSVKNALASLNDIDAGIKEYGDEEPEIIN